MRARHALAGALSVLAGLLVAACGDDDPYITSCSVDSDCVVVPIGAECGCQNCRRTTINRSDVERYNDDRQDADVDCDEQGGVCTGLPCSEPSAFCANETCALR
jgi:hypothetical protein